ncbi:glycoprotein [Nile warbler virus]|uniref:Envelopment polyprotein n=1 Tax=Nile warbler virus TaxID=2848001 RepID=I1T336_9VIRU|nr:glycoprotein [Nile warbler virus]AEL29653.1 glycoprotein [Nile warbler virus]
MVRLILLLLVLVPPGQPIFNKMMDVIRRISESSNTTWQRDQPGDHRLSKLDTHLASILSVGSHIEEVSTNHSQHLKNFRAYDCGEGRNILTMLDPKTGKFRRLKCLDNQTLSKDCSTCLDTAPSILKSNHLVYDDGICQSDYSPSEAMPEHDTHLCRVGFLFIRHCSHDNKRIQHVPWFWIDGKLSIFDDYSISWIEGKFLSLFDCKNESQSSAQCDKAVCLQGKCTGDLQFCTEFSCTYANAACTCKRNSVPGIAQVHTKRGSFIPTCFGQSLWSVRKPLSKRSVLVQQMCLDCESSCQSDHILVIVRHFTPDHYQACLGSTCLTGRAKDKEFQVPFRMADRLSDSSFEIKMWNKERTHEYFLTSRCESVDACEAITCWFCRANWANLHCFSKEQVLILIVIISICTIILASVLRALRVIASFIWKLLKPFYWICSLLYRACKRKVNRKAEKLKEQIQSLEDGLSEPLTEAKSQPAPVKARPSSRQKMYNLTRLSPAVVCIFCFLGSTEACSDSLSVTATNQRCSTNSQGINTCFISTSSLLQVSPKGQESCLILKNPTGVAVDTIRIKTNDIRLECVRRDLYWTPRVTHRCVGVRRCHLMGDCQGESCSAFKITDYSAEWGHEEELMAQLGWSYCIEQCGGALCQCFNMRPSCFYLRKTFTPLSQDAYNIYECSEWSYRINVVVYTNNTESNITLKLGVPDSIPHGMISLSTVSQPPAIAYTECFGEDLHNTKFHTVCNRRTDYTLGRIGEIQCPTKADALAISKRCVSSDSIVFSKVHKDSVDCRSSIIDPQTIRDRNKLPSTVGSVTFWPTETSVEAAVPDLASATMMIRLDGYQVQYQSDSNKCSVRFLSLTGCYNCETGAKLEIEHVTDFGTALAILECPSLGYTTYYDVRNALEKATRTMHLNGSHVDARCLFKCPNSESQIKVKGELIYLFNDDVRHHNQTLSPGLAPKQGTGWDPFGWFKASWMRSIWAILGGTVALIIGVVGTYMALSLCLKVKKS